MKNLLLISIVSLFALFGCEKPSSVKDAQSDSVTVDSVAVDTVLEKK